MEEHDWLAERFEQHRVRLRSVAYRMLGSLSDADDAVQEAWLRLSRSDYRAVENLAAWLTTVVARVSLSMLQARKTRREASLPEHLPDPIISVDDRTDPEQEALLADSVGLALLVVLDTLNPAERLAFVLHDMFAVPFDDIARILDRSPTAARQLASRARRRVHGAPVPDPDLDRQRQVIGAFLTAARAGDFDALLEVLDPDVVARAEAAAPPGGLGVYRGAEAVARQALSGARPAALAHHVLINGAAGLLITEHRQPTLAMAFTVSDGKITSLDIIADPERLRRLDLTGATARPARGPG